MLLDYIDAALSSVRETVEHHYGQADEQWPFMSYDRKLKISNMPLGAIYSTKMILRNFHVCLIGNLTSERFGISPPLLEQYAA